MAISETITVDAGEAIDSLNELAAAAEDVAGKFAGLDGTLKAGFAGAGAGPDKMIAAWDKAATSVSASVDKIGASIGKLDELGALAGAAGPADLVAKWDTAAAGVAASIDKIAASAGKLDDIGAGAGAAADEVKGLGAAGDAAAGGLGRAADAAKGLTVGTHGTTFGGNPLAMAIGNAVLDIVLAPGFIENVARLGLLARQQLAELQDRHPRVIEEVRGEGLLIGLKLKVAPADFAALARDHRLLTIPAGDGVVRLLPPLVVSDEELSEGMRRLHATCAAAEASLAPRPEVAAA